MPAGLTALAATYVSSTQYTLIGDQTVIHEQYRPILMVKNDDSVVGDCYVVSSAYAGGVTTVTISGAVVPATIVSGSIGDISIPGNNSALPIEYLNTQYLNRTNVGVFVPGTDYEPATKKYVDDSTGVSDHSLLTNLDYASAGHTGFQASGDYVTDAEITTISGDLQTNIDAKISDLSDDTTPQLGGDLDANTHAIVAADHTTSSGVDQVVNVCYGTGEAPTANTTTIGSLYIKYTA